jgi:transcription termination factor Rho
MLKKLANVIELSNQNVITLSLLINRRPEEVFEYKRNVKGEVISIGYEEDGKQQVEVAEVILAKAKRLVELGKDVVMFIDDVTNLVKAYDYANSLVDTTGSESLRAIKKYLSSARNIENGGSLTILAIADVNSKRAEFLCSELKGVVNSEITLSTELANRGIYPSIIISDTFTRNANYLTGGKDFQLSYKLREIDDIREVIRLIDEGEEF